MVEWSKKTSKQILYFKNLTLSTKVFINVVFPVPAYPFRINSPISLFDIRNLLNSPIAAIWSSVGENENLCLVGLKKNVVLLNIIN